MRSAFDRLRHAISFEIIALILVIPAGAILFDVPLHDFGVVGIVSATLATLWNLGYNVLFDLALQRLTGTTLKSRIVRVLHALVFEPVGCLRAGYRTGGILPRLFLRV